MMPEKIRIGLVTPFFLPQIGGANLYCFELARALAGWGHEVHLFTVQGAREDPAYIQHPVLNGELAHDLAALAPFEMDVWHGLFFFYTPLALHKPNVFITAHGDDGFSMRIRYRPRLKPWLDRHLLWRLPSPAGARLDRAWEGLEVAANRRIYARAGRKARRIVTVSRFTRERLAERYPGLRDRISVIPPGVSDDFFSGALGRKRPELLLTVSRIDEADRIKNIHNVIEALGRLKDRFDFEYRIVGGAQRGAYRDELEGRIRRLGLAHRVILEGRVSDERLRALYDEAGLFILCSYAEPENFEGFGIVFLEANARGTPVLTTREGGMTDYVREGVNGFYTGGVDAPAIARALERYFSGGIHFDPGAIRAAPEPYRWRNIARRMLETYATHGVST